MANYKVLCTTDDVQWPAYVSTIILEGELLHKAENVLEKALVTLQAYGGPNFNVSLVKSANRTAIFLYDIIADLTDEQGNVRECHAMILNEPWMKANSVATASLEFMGTDGEYDKSDCKKFVMKRKKSLRYYKDNEMMFETDV